MFHRTRTWIFFVLIVSVVCLSMSVVFAQDATPEAVGLRPDAPTYAVHGPYWVGTRQMEIPEKDGKPALKLTLWYPALNPKNQKEEFAYHPVMKYDPLPTDIDPSTYVYAGHALGDADPNGTDAPYPLVVFSHGSFSSPSYYTYLLEHLASYGLIVIAPDHVEMNHLNEENSSVFASSFIDRPLDTIRTLDYAEVLNKDDSAFKALIDMNRVAMVGQSAGGYDALVAAGARYDLIGYNARCAALAKDDPNQGLCSIFVPFENDMVKWAGLESMPTGLWPSWGDKRIKSIVTMAGDSYLFDKAGLAEINIPVLAIGGTRDEATAYEWGVRPTYDNISSQQKALVTFENANHYMFLNDCSTAPWWSTKLGAYWFCSDSIWDMNRAHDLINHFTTAYLLDQLKGDKEAAKALAPDAVSFPGIKYESQGF